MGADVLDVQGAADQRPQRRVGLHALRHVQLGFAEVADARRETEAQQVHQGEDVIGEAGRVGVVLLDPQVGLVVQQAVEHIGGIAGTVAKLAMRQPFVLFKGLTFQKLCLPGAFRPGDHHNKMLRPGLCVVHASPQYL